MAYCRKCGSLLNDNVEFCRMCGAPVRRVEDIEDSVSEPAMSPQTKEESIALAEKLKAEYGAVEKLQREISDNETILRRPVVPSGGRYSFFRFFWPFIIFAYIAFNALVIVGALTISSSIDETGFTVCLLIGLALAVGLLVFGGVRAARKRNRLNELLLEEEHQMLQNQNDIEKRTEELKAKLKNKRSALAEYQTLVPGKFRTKRYMDRVIMFLQTGKAETFADAINMLKGTN